MIVTGSRAVDLPPPISVSRNVIVASPNADLRERLVELMRASGWVVEEASRGTEVIEKLSAGEYSLLLLDAWFHDLDAEEIAETARHRYPGTAVHMLRDSAEAPDQSAESLVSNLLGDLESGLPPQHADVSPSQIPNETPAHEEPLPGMIGSSQEMQHVYRMVRMVAPRLTTVIILGGTGTGKELVARAVHLLGPRSRQPFVTVNCAAIPEALIEAELFGYTRGAFTGAIQTRIGRLQAAHGGTLFLDEIGDLPMGMQAKLLRFLQEGEVQRLGSTDVIRVSVRVIAATNVDLAEHVRQKTFREDLYYRLSVFPIYIEPLQRRAEDILPLTSHFLTGLCREIGAPPKKLSPEGRAILVKHAWPGNVRELQHVIERAFILAGDSPEIRREHILLHTV
jgi:DNA-binding NtrC family response regulator